MGEGPCRPSRERTRRPAGERRGGRGGAAAIDGGVAASGTGDGRRGLIVRRIWAVCLLLAGLNHARILFLHGLFWDYRGIGGLSAAYWTGLTLIDPAVAALLLWRPAIGIPATILLIGTNVAHNLVVGARYARDLSTFADYVTGWQVLAQIGFLAFVLATRRLARAGT